MIKLSWRNIWRNRRRALITMASILFAVFFCSIMNSQTKGMWGRMIDNTLRTQNGHIEIHGKGWWDDKVIDNFLTMDSNTIERLRALDNIENLSPRIETFVLASVGNVTKGVALVAISPEQENAKSKLATRIVQGNYLAENDNGVLIGAGLAKYLKASAGDTLAFLGQGHFGASAAGLFPVRGILNLAIPEMSNTLIYTSLPAAQAFIDLPNGYSGILITLKDSKKLDESIEIINSELAVGSEMETKNSTASCEVMSWHFTMKKLLETARSDQAFGNIILFILYMIVGFGILGTVIMLTTERMREFRTMVSLGMSRRRLQGVVVLELLFMTFIGLFAGVALAMSVAYYFHVKPIEIGGEMGGMFLDMGMEPIIPFSVEPQIFISQLVIVSLISIIAVIYPLRKIKRLKLHN